MRRPNDHPPATKAQSTDRISRERHKFDTKDVAKSQFSAPAGPQARAMQKLHKYYAVINLVARNNRN